MTDAEPAPPAPIRNFEWKVPIPACKLSRDDIKSLYKIIDDKQIEDRDDFVNNVLELQPNETPEIFSARKERVRDACRTTITVNGINGEWITGHGEAFLDSSILPERIASIYFDTKSRYNAFLGLPRRSWASVLLDFRAPPPIDWIALPSAPTPNASNYNVSTQNEAWGSSLNARLDKFLTERKTKRDWLHKQAVYDLLFFALALPIILWAEARLGMRVIEGRQLPLVLSSTIYVYLFFVFANVFRAIFSYARWVFPKIEFDSVRSSTAAHRAILLALLIGIVGSALWDALKALW